MKIFNYLNYEVEQKNFLYEALEINIEEKNIPAYLKEIGKMNLLLGVLFVGKACLDIPFPGSRPILYGWLLILLLCVFSISKIDTKYKKQ